MLPVVNLDKKAKRKAYWQEWYKKNKERSRAYGKAWYQAHKEQAKEMSRKSELMRNFGLTRQDYNRMFQIQGGMCAICGIHQMNVNKNLRIDHDHRTGKNRGLLCHNCNVSLGLLKESIPTLKQMIVYLESH